tara:strand:- start:250 stop:684 length:435 start_codon:yes stop_codon:yes gene_type:complete
MIKPPKDTDINKVNEMLELSLDCYFLSAIVACWTLKQNLNNGYPVYIVTLTNKEMLSHTVCVIKGVGTLDGKNNLFIPNYYYHKAPATQEQLNNAKPVFDWFDTQRKSHDHCKQWIIYNTNDIIDKKLLLFGDYTSFTNSWKIF